jgi:hypothetical protein
MLIQWGLIQPNPLTQLSTNIQLSTQLSTATHLLARPPRVRGGDVADQVAVVEGVRRGGEARADVLVCGLVGGEVEGG